VGLPPPSPARADKIRIVSAITVVGFVAAVVFHYLMGHRAGLAYPYNTFLFRPDDRFADFSNIYHYLRNDHLLPEKVVQLVNYPPFAYLLLRVFTVLPLTLALPSFLSVTVGAILYVSYQALHDRTWYLTLGHVLTIVCLSYPLIFTVDRANVEGLVFVLVYWAAEAYSRQRVNASAALLAVATAMKVFPGVFLALPWVDRKYREVGLAILLIVGFTVLGLAVQGGNWWEHVQTLGRNASNYQAHYAVLDEGLFFGHSLWGALKGGVRMLGDQMLHQYLLQLIYIFYPVLALLLLGFTVAYLGWVEKELWKRVALLVCAMNLLPFVSADYKLMHLYTPLFLFLNAPHKGRLDRLYAVLFGLLLIPKAYAQWGVSGEIHEATIINPLLMILLCLVIMASGLARRGRERRRGGRRRETPPPIAGSQGMIP
jgi:hypothetical protein